MSQLNIALTLDLTLSDSLWQNDKKWCDDYLSSVLPTIEFGVQFRITKMTFQCSISKCENEENEKWKMKHEKWKMKNAKMTKWKMNNAKMRKWKMRKCENEKCENEKWKMKNAKMRKCENEKMKNEKWKIKKWWCIYYGSSVVSFIPGYGTSIQ